MNTTKRWLLHGAVGGFALRPNPHYREPLVTVDPRASDGKKTVIIHGKKVSETSPKRRWPGAELWGLGRCNTFYWCRTLTDWDRWFDLHPVERTPHHKGIQIMRPDAWAWYQRLDQRRPVYLLAHHPAVPASIPFPRAWVQETLPGSPFTVSVDWVIALALCEGFDRVVLNGIGTRRDPEYAYSHQGILYWIGFARGRGVDVVVEGPSCYATPPHVYGYECGAPAWERSGHAVHA
jgi:hypothetical protein